MILDEAIIRYSQTCSSSVQGSTIHICANSLTTKGKDFPATGPTFDFDDASDSLSQF